MIEVVKALRPDIVYLQETKVDQMSNNILVSIWKGRWVGCWVNAVGTARGILILCDSSVLSRSDVLQGAFSLSCLFQSLKDGSNGFSRYTRLLMLLGENCGKS